MDPLHPWGAVKVVQGLEGKAGGVAVVTWFVQPGGERTRGDKDTTVHHLQALTSPLSCWGWQQPCGESLWLLQVLNHT